MRWWQRLLKTGPTPKGPFYARLSGTPSDVEVFDRDGYRVMRFVDEQRLVQGKRHLKDSNDFGLEYLQQHVLASLIPSSVNQVLVLGLGVGALPHLVKLCMPSAQIRIVELNEAVFESARKFFDFKTSESVSLEIDDAVSWVERNQQSRFDLIFNDCFDGLQTSLPTRRTKHLENMASLLNDGGTLVTNTIKPSCNAPKDFYRVLKRHGHAHVWAAPNKSNLSLVWSSEPIHWDNLQARARAIDQSIRFPFSLETESIRVRRATESGGQLD